MDKKLKKLIDTQAADINERFYQKYKLGHPSVTCLKRANQ